MTKEIAWNKFKNTGSIDTFLQMKRLENIQIKRVGADEYSKNEGNNNCGK